MAEMSATEAAEVLDSLNNSLLSGNTTEALNCAVSVLRKVAAGELREVVHGEWTIKQDMRDRAGLFIRIVCSNCGLQTGEKSKYCPLCGALMEDSHE